MGGGREVKGGPCWVGGGTQDLAAMRRRGKGAGSGHTLWPERLRLLVSLVSSTKW